MGFNSGEDGVGPIKTVNSLIYSTDYKLSVITLEIYLVESGAPNENIVQNHLNIASLNVF